MKGEPSNGRASGIRTHGPRHPKTVRYQAALLLDEWFPRQGSHLRPPCLRVALHDSRVSLSPTVQGSGTGLRSSRAYSASSFWGMVATEGLEPSCVGYEPTLHPVLTALPTPFAYLPLRAGSLLFPPLWGSSGTTPAGVLQAYSLGRVLSG